MKRITKTGTEITANDDARRYYMGNGNVHDLQNGKHEGAFFVVPGTHKNPFTITFGDDYSVSVNPGSRMCYGRLINVNEAERVIDDITLDYIDSSAKAYVYIYLQVDLDNLGEENAHFFHKYVKTLGNKEAKYPEIECDDNLFELGFGIYDIPIASFLYNPKATDKSTMFGTPTYYFREPIAGEKETTNNLVSDGYIGSSSVSSVLDGLTNGEKLVPKRADYADYAPSFGESESNCTPVAELLLSRTYRLYSWNSTADYVYFLSPLTLLLRFRFTRNIQGHDIPLIISCHDITPGRENLNNYDGPFVYGYLVSPTKEEAESGEISVCIGVKRHCDGGGYKDPQISLATPYEAGWFRDYTGIQDPNKAVDGLYSSDFIFPFIEISITPYRRRVIRNKITVRSYYGPSPREYLIEPPVLFNPSDGGEWIVQALEPLIKREDSQ